MTPGELAGERVVHGRRGVSGEGRVLGTTGEMDTEKACLFRDRYAFRGGCTSMVAQYVGLRLRFHGEWTHLHTPFSLTSPLSHP